MGILRSFPETGLGETFVHVCVGFAFQFIASTQERLLQPSVGTVMYHQDPNHTGTTSKHHRSLLTVWLFIFSFFFFYQNMALVECVVIIHARRSYPHTALLDAQASRVYYSR